MGTYLIEIPALSNDRCEACKGRNCGGVRFHDLLPQALCLSMARRERLKEQVEQVDQVDMGTDYRVQSKHHTLNIIAMLVA